MRLLQSTWRYADAADLACQGVSRVESFATTLGLVSCAVLPVAWWARPRVGAAGQQTMWSLAALLVGVMQVMVCMFLVPGGCWAGHTMSHLVAAAAPWVVAAGIFRSAVAPAPSP